MIPSRSFSNLLRFLPAPSLVRSSAALSTAASVDSSVAKTDQWETVDEYKIQISKKSKPKLAEIPWQARVANAVQLIGKVAVPVKLVKGRDGSEAAVTALVQDRASGDSPQFWIPLVFQGDLAGVADLHLEENDAVYVTGKLSGDALPSPEVEEKQSNLQVIVQSLSFVQNLAPMKKSEAKLIDKEMLAPEALHDLFLSKKKFQAGTKDAPQVEHKFKSNDKIRRPAYLSEDLIANPNQWFDCRPHKQTGAVKRTFPDFKHKISGDGIWCDSLPDTIMSKLNDLTFTILDRNTKDIHSSSPEKTTQETQEKTTQETQEKTTQHKDTQEKMQKATEWLTRAPNFLQNDSVEKKKQNSSDFIENETKANGESTPTS